VSLCQVSAVLYTWVRSGLVPQHIPYKELIHIQCWRRAIYAHLVNEEESANINLTIVRKFRHDVMKSSCHVVGIAGCNATHVDSTVTHQIDMILLDQHLHLTHCSRVSYFNISTSMYSIVVINVYKRLFFYKKRVFKKSTRKLKMCKKKLRLILMRNKKKQ